MQIRKYPRTPHIQGSNLQAGDEDISQIPFSKIQGQEIVVEEKIDGANTGISFDENGKLYLQSRGKFLEGGYREKHYQLFKVWAIHHSAQLYEALGDRYVMYGEWMYVKHHVYYDALPGYFIEFDIYDKKENCFLDTPSRRKITEPLHIPSVPVLKVGKFRNVQELLKLIGPSNYIGPQSKQKLAAYVAKKNLPQSLITDETDPSSLMEGLYIKVEKDGKVADRMKYVRRDYKQYAVAEDQNWLEHPVVPNGITVPQEEWLKH